MAGVPQQEYRYPTTIAAAPILCTGRLLDSVPPVGSPLGLAFSVRKVSSRYRGPCMRVRRSSDNSERDIDFFQTSINIDQLLEFCSGFNGFVTTWYDQTNQGRHAVQADPVFQPLVVVAGVYQKGVQFNGSYLKTAWNPTEAEVAGGAGMAVCAAVGATQPGVVEEIPLAAGLNVMTGDFPNTLLPDGHDAYLLEGVQVGADGSTVVYSEGGMLTELNVDVTAQTTTKTISAETTPGGPATLTLQTLDTTVAGTPPANQWRRGLKLFSAPPGTPGRVGRIYAIPYNAAVLLEIDYMNKIIKTIALPAAAATVTTARWYMGVAGSADAVRGYCLPYNARYVLEIDATTVSDTATATVNIIGPDYGTRAGKWSDMVRSEVNGRLYAVPYNENRILEIDSVTRTTATIPLPAGVPVNGRLFSAAAAWTNADVDPVVPGKVFGMPALAATLLVLDLTTTGAATIARLSGTTGMSAYVTGGGRGYTEAPSPSVAAPNDPAGQQMTFVATIEQTGTLTALPILTVNGVTGGTGYVESPRVAVFLKHPTGSRGSLPNTYNTTYPPVFDRPSPFAVVNGNVSPTMAPVNANNLQLGYKITGLTWSDGGDNLTANNFVNGSLFVWSGKGTRPLLTPIIQVDQLGIGRLTAVGVSNGGSGFTSIPTILLQGGSGSGATAIVPPDGLSPIVYSQVGTELRSTGGGIVKVQVTNQGTGYTMGRPPTIVVVGGKGVNATLGTPTITLDGRITQVTIAPGAGGTGYATESNVEARSTTRTITIATPGAGGGNPRGMQATARVSALGAGNAIATVEIVDGGSGYIANPVVTFRAPGGGGTTATPTTATWTIDGRIANSGYALPTQQIGTRYTTPPLVTGLDNRGPGTTPTHPPSTLGGQVVTGQVATIEVFNEGQSNGSPSTVYITGISRGYFGYDKFIDKYVYNASVFTLPYNSTRALKIDARLDTMTDIGTGLFPNNNFAQYSGGVATRDNTKFYGIPYNRKYVPKIIGATGNVELVGGNFTPTTYNGRWNAGVAAWNNNIYCVPTETSALLVINVNQDTKSEVVAFSDLRGIVLSKWWDVVLAGDSPGDGLLYGIPADLSVVLELNPGVALRAKALPSPACALLDARRVVFAPHTTSAPPGRAVSVYDSALHTKTEHAITSPGNVTYSDGVAVAANLVVFAPCFNLNDPFTYEGKVGLFDPTSNVFTYGPVVPIDYSTPYPSRSLVSLGNGNVAWVPRESANAMVVYDIAAGTVTPSAGQRQQTRVTYASSRVVGSGNVAVFQPTVTTVGRVPGGISYDGGASRNLVQGYTFGGCTLARDAAGLDVLVCPPGSELEHVTLFYPSDPGAPLKTAAEIEAAGVGKVTVLVPPDDIALDFVQLASERKGNKFWGAVTGADNKVYCIPYQRHKILVVDPASLSMEELGDYAEEWDLAFAGPTQGDPGGNLWRGGVLGGDRVVYCAPFNARRILAINPAVTNPARRSYLVGPALGAGGEKWNDAAVGKDGRLFFAPCSQSRVLVYDSAQQVASFIELGGTQLERFSGIVNGPDGLLYLVPWNSHVMLGIQATSTSVAKTVDVLTRDFRKFGLGLVGRNQKIYLLPFLGGYGSTVEYDPVSNDLVNYDSAGYWAWGAAARDGYLYAFRGRYADYVLRIVPDTRSIGVFAAVTGAYSPRVDTPLEFRLRPFVLNNGTSVLYHTGNGTYAVYDTANAQSSLLVVGPVLRDGVAATFPMYNDKIATVAGNVLSIISPLQGGIAGLKSSSGNADLFMIVEDKDLMIGVGNGRSTVAGIYRSLFPAGTPGVYAALGSSTKGTLVTTVRESSLGARRYGWSGASGNAFSVGRIEGTPTPAANIPGFRSAYNGLVSEVVAFTSDQQARAAALGDSAAFYFLG